MKQVLFYPQKAGAYWKLVLKDGRTVLFKNTKEKGQIREAHDSKKVIGRGRCTVALASQVKSIVVNKVYGNPPKVALTVGPHVIYVLSKAEVLVEMMNL